LVMFCSIFPHRGDACHAKMQNLPRLKLSQALGHGEEFGYKIVLAVRPAHAPT